MPERALVFHLIPHTHWDREWYLPAPAFRARLVEMIDDLLARLERDAAYRTFLLDGQTVLVEDYLAVRPEREPALHRLVADGRLQVGPWYVLADELVPSGEAHVRNLLAGARDARRLGGRSEVLYSPDAFGHPAAWPDLAAGFGIGAGVIWRGFRGTRDLARWRGLTGAEVVVYHLPPDGYEVGGALPAAPDRLAAAWAPVRAALVARAATPHVAVFVGADHHFAHAELPALRERLAALEPAHDVRVSRLDEFLDAARAAAARGGRPLRLVRGELRDSYGYTWTLQGTLGTRAHLKRRNALVELALERLAEPLAALAGASGGPAALLRHAWRTLLRNQFHDSLCGTSSDAVAEAMAVRFAAADAVACEVARRAVHRLVGHDPDAAREAAPGTPRAALALWNPAARAHAGDVIVADLTAFRRDVLVGPPGARRPGEGAGWTPIALRTADGRLLPLQVLGRRVAQRRVDADRHYPDQDLVDHVRVAFRAPALAGLGAALLDAVPLAPSTTPPEGDVVVRGRALANDAVEVVVGADGTLRITDRRTGVRHDRLLALESTPDLGDSYTPYLPPRSTARGRRGPVRVRTLASGPLVGVLEARWRHPGLRGPVRLVVRLHAGSPLVHCRLAWVNRARNHRLCARLPFGLPGARLLTGTQFGLIERAPGAPDADATRETPLATAPMHRVAAAEGEGRGLALLLPGFAEVEWTKGGDLLLTVLRAVGVLSRDDLPTRPGHAGWAQPIPQAQCLGPDAIDLALLPLGRADARDGAGLFAAWEDAFLPAKAWWLPATVAAGPEIDGVELRGGGLVVSAVKPTDDDGDGLVLRCVNLASRRVRGHWHFARPRTEAWRARADEHAQVAVPLVDGGRTLQFLADPGAIVTHVVR